MANSGDQPPSTDVVTDLDRTELKVKQRLAKQAEVEVVEETLECSRMATKEPASHETAAEGRTGDNGEDQSPNSDESDRTVVDTGQLQFMSLQLLAIEYTELSFIVNFPTTLLLLHTHTHTQPFYCWSGICPGPPGSAGTRKVKPRRLKPIWIYWSKR